MVNNKQVEWSYWICSSVLFGCCYLSFFEEENDREGESKEFKVMVMIDIFWYLTWLVGSGLPLLMYMDLAWFWSWDSLLSI
jgi:hypothetical protein